MTEHSRRRPSRSLVAALAGTACVAALALPPAFASADSSADGAIKKLHATVGPGYTLTIKESTVPAGKYKIIVDDKSTIHNFHMTGPGGVDIKTKVSQVVKKAFKVTLKAGTYSAVCDPHPTMKDSLVVT